METPEKAERRRAYQRKYYRLRRAQPNDIRTWFNEYKQTLSCIQCGESDSRCLDFHHRNGKKSRYYSVSALVANRKSKRVILREVEACDVLCANCHRKLHLTTGEEFAKSRA